MTKWLVITVMACTLTVCGSPAYAKSFSSSMMRKGLLPQANGASV